jgi:hypothetical protein
MHLRLADEGTSAILEIATDTLQDFQIPTSTEGYWLDARPSKSTVNGGQEFVCTDPSLIKYTVKKSRT